VCGNKLGLILGDSQRVGAAIEVFARAIERAERLNRSGPMSGDLADLLAWNHHNLGFVLIPSASLVETFPLCR
jgi:hypothetical protein